MKLIDNKLVMENAGDFAHVLETFKYWNTRWMPNKDYVLQRIPDGVIQALGEAWLEATREECE